jgi:putative hydrolase of HD superfamily
MRGIDAGESIADHCFRMTALVMVLADEAVSRGQQVDVERALRMAVLHEFGESLIGDIPRNEGSPVSTEVKRSVEGEALAALTRPLAEQGARYRRLWEEFEDGDSFEAKLVRAADKLEMLIQAREYESIGYRCLDDFWKHRAGRSDVDEVGVAAEIARLLDTAVPHDTKGSDNH